MRWNSSPVSTQTFGHIPPFARAMHFLSRSEHLLALLFGWVGCHVREQFPLWPWLSPHPLYGYQSDLDAQLPWALGTLELCKRAGVTHGMFVGTKIPYIWTIDLVLTLAWLPPDRARIVFVSVKPLSNELYTGDTDPIARSLEKLEIERRNAVDLKSKYIVADRSTFPGPLLGQLDAWRSAAVLPTDGKIAIARDGLLERFGDSLAELPPIEWRDRLVSDYGLVHAEADTAMHNIFWRQWIDVDLTRIVDPERLVKPGGRALKRRLRTYLEAV